MAESCPRCGAPDADGEKCPRCGVIIPLYKVALAKFRREVPAETPAVIQPTSVADTASTSTPTDGSAATATDGSPSTPTDGSATLAGGAATAPTDASVSTPTRELASTPPAGFASTPADGFGATPARGFASTPTDGSVSPPIGASGATASPSASTHRLTFHGRGGTLFGLHIVNVLLTVVTLGVFAFWAKVRVRRYLLAASEFAGDRFAYHGTGGELLLGFTKAMIVFFVPLAFLQASAMLSGDPRAVAATRLAATVAAVVFVPVAVVGARRYRLSRTSWRGIRLGFDGALADYVKLFLISTLLTLVTLGFYYPVSDARSRAFLISHSRFGTRTFGYDGVARATFRPYLVAALLALPTLGLSFFWYLAWRRRYYWEHTTFERARFRCTVTGGRLLGLWALNVLLLLVTLGAAWPWVRVRNARFAFATLSLEGPLALDAIVQGAPVGSATGDALSSVIGAGFEFGA